MEPAVRHVQRQAGARAGLLPAVASASFGLAGPLARGCWTLAGPRARSYRRGSRSRRSSSRRLPCAPFAGAGVRCGGAGYAHRARPAPPRFARGPFPTGAVDVALPDPAQMPSAAYSARPTLAGATVPAIKPSATRRRRDGITDVVIIVTPALAYVTASRPAGGSARASRRVASFVALLGSAKPQPSGYGRRCACSTRPPSSIVSPGPGRTWITEPRPCSTVRGRWAR